MDDSKTTPISVTYVFRDGRRVALGAGRIDGLGRIAVDAPERGQEDYVAGLIAELNAREDVIVKEPPAEGAERFAISKRRVLRVEEGFLLDLKAYAMRVYSLELDFDETAFDPPSFDPGPGVAPPEAPPGDTTDTELEEETTEGGL